MAGEWKNRLKNLAATPMRLLRSVGYAGVDIAKTGTALAKDPAEISMNTIQDIQELFQEAGKRGTMRHKVGNLPWATALSGVKLGEGTIRSGVNTAVNFIKNSWGTLKNFGSNVITSLAHTFSPKPISDVSFKHLSTEAVSKNWDMKSLLIAAGIVGSTATTAQVQVDSEPTPVVAESSKSVINEENKKTIGDLTKKFEQQEKTNQELQKTLLATKADVDATKKENVGLKTLLEQHANDRSSDTKKELDQEKIDSDSESPKKKEKNLAKENKVSFDPKALDYQAHTLEKDLNTFAGANKYIIETKKATQSSGAQLKISPKNSEYTNYILTIYEPGKVNARVNVDKNESYEGNISLEQATRQGENNIWTSSLDATSPADHLIKLGFKKI